MSTLIYVVGPSGAGKDTLLARARLETLHEPIVFAHRYITRPSSAGGENHVALSAAEFETRRQLGLFALSWNSHGLSYGIGIEAFDWLRAGAVVVANGSREALSAAAQAFPRMAITVITAPPDLLRQRLQDRGRESPEQIESRLQRAERFALAGQRAYTVENSGTIEEGGAALAALLRRFLPASAPSTAAART